MQPRVSMIAAVGRNRELGLGNGLLWHIPEDLKRFKALTLGHPVIMGRKTFESIGKPLPGRTNLVVSRSALSLEDALAQAKKLDKEEVFIIGGAQIYEQALPYADRLYLTLIEDTKEADAFFPEYEKLFTKKVSEEPREYEGLQYRWVTLEK
ncbi:MAG: Dihydrofolate reductase [Parcubacteria group bacterium GW2011_GWA1_53_13]|nr:MAG: Dihydrofolate reductase [Parcubacteria group bacterium GW2011_GWA1_53_13]